MSTEQTKVAVYRPKVERSSRELAAASSRKFAAEEEQTELALAMACEDPTEKEHLASNVGRARERLKAAAVELVRAFFALTFAWLARLLVKRSLGKIAARLAARRGRIGHAEGSALALQRLMGGFFIRRIIGVRRLLRALGANSRTDDEDNTIHSLKVAERRYRACDASAADKANASDLPLIRVFVGVRLGVDGEPVWSLKRFVRDEAGSTREVHSGCCEDAETALIYFYMEPSHHRPAADSTAVQELKPARHSTRAAA